jgi:hypothetical protein
VHRITVITALRHERSALRAVAQRHRATILCLGPGAACAERLRTLDPRPNALLLAGVAGGLTHNPRVSISTVIDDDTGARFTPTLAHDDAGATLVTARAPACTPDDKRALNARTGADLVDCETAHLARACDDLDIPWTALRAVSDGPDDALPREAMAWIDDAGALRPTRLARDIVARPALINDLRALHRNSKRALRALAHELDGALRDLA